MKKRSAAMLMLIILSPLFTLGAVATDNNLVKPAETYELANIILAITKYGKADPWEVNKNSAYYREVITYFDRYRTHPLLDSVNYSRKEWENYLSFRTDAYAFEFNPKGTIVRTKLFYANKGFSPFDQHLKLINNFVKTTGFRAFYREHCSYYQKLTTAYLQSQHYPEMIDLLSQEFGKQQIKTKYAIVVSPLVGRMNCHRVVDGTQTDFITLPDFLLDGKAVDKATQQEIASGTHMLFTELDHGFINPVTSQYRHLLKSNFIIQKWDSGSGYEKDSLATFNEYMTWATYDLFVQKYFPQVAAKVSTNWAMQNETRGFYASSLFNRELMHLYTNRKPGETIKDLYPSLIKRLGWLQEKLSKPAIAWCNLDQQTIRDTVPTVELSFSEAMLQADTIEVFRLVQENGNNILTPFKLTNKEYSLKWSNDGIRVEFQFPLVIGKLNQLVFNYAWKISNVLQTRSGVNLPPYTLVKITVTADKDGQ
jgi:hypothetical protein